VASFKEEGGRRGERARGVGASTSTQRER